jgi:hypothetical protein
MSNGKQIAIGNTQKLFAFLFSGFDARGENLN